MRGRQGGKERGLVHSWFLSPLELHRSLSILNVDHADVAEHLPGGLGRLEFCLEDRGKERKGK